MKILAIDFGLKRIGFAFGNTVIRTAVPIPPAVRKNKEEDIRCIKNLIDEYDIAKIIVGYPLNMDGTKSLITRQVENFTKELKKKTGMDTEFVDERLTSFEAEEELKSIQPDYKKRKKIIDSISAWLMLKSYVENRGE
jgi:putative Holliday junction resolvase